MGGEEYSKIKFLKMKYLVMYISKNLRKKKAEKENTFYVKLFPGMWGLWYGYAKHSGLSSFP